MIHREKSLNFCSILPPHILHQIALRGTRDQKTCALETLIQTEQFRGFRTGLGPFAFFAATHAAGKKRTVCDARHKNALPGKLIRAEGDKKNKDVAVNEAYDGAGAHYDFFKKIYTTKEIP